MAKPIYTEQNTNVDIIVKNCRERNAEDKDNNCVLIITGSLNPIHFSHIKNLQLVRLYLKNHKTRPLNVLAAYLSPTHDSYVRNKLGQSDWIPAEKRSELCEKVIEDENLTSFISVAKGEYLYDRFADFDEVTIELETFLNRKLCTQDRILQHPLKVVYVCGLDHFNKCYHVQDLAKEKNIACAVIYRLGASDNSIKALQEASSNIYYITLDDERQTLVDISSTAIRRHSRDPANTNLEELTYRVVIDYLNDKYQKQ